MDNSCYNEIYEARPPGHENVMYIRMRIAVFPILKETNLF